MSTTALNEFLDWPGAQQVCQITRERTKGGQTTVEVGYFITSLSREQADAKKLLQLIRDHWGATENGLHWVRDEVMGEDRSTMFRGHAPHNFAAMRNAALNWLRRNDYQEIAKTLRSFFRNSHRLFAKLGFVK